MEVKPDKYKCKKHGDIGDAIMSIKVDVEGHESDDTFCLICLSELLRRKIGTVEKVD